MSKYLGPALIAAGAAAGAFAVKLGVDAVGAASDLMETQNKVGVIFGNSSDAVLEFGDTAVTALGQTQTQALEAAATFAQFGKAAGLAGNDLVDFSTEFVTLSADLASFNNSSPEEAITALGSALRGEAEPLRRFGVLLDDATLKTKAMEMGISDGTSKLTTQQKVLAAHAVVLEQTTDAQGDFARTADGLANTTRILSAAVEDAKAEIGLGLVAAIETATGAMGGSKGMAETISQVGQNVGDLTRGFGELIAETDNWISSLQGIEDATGDTEQESTLLLNAINSLRVSVALATAGGSELLIMLTNNGQAARLAAGEIDSLYDSTIALAKAQRAAAYEQQLSNATLADSAYDSGIAAAKAADRLARLTKILGHAPGVLDDVTKSTKGASSAIEELTKWEKRAEKSQDSLSESLKLTEGDLKSATAKFFEAGDAVRDYASAIQGDLLSGIDLGGAFEAQFDEAGKATGESLIGGFNKQIEQATWFGNVLNEIKRQNADVRLIEEIASLGPAVGGALGQQLIDDGLIPTMSDKFASVQDVTADLAMGLVPEYKLAGVASAAASIVGLTEGLQAEQIGTNPPKAITTVTAMGNLSALGLQEVGAAGWTEQTASQRVTGILTASGFSYLNGADTDITLKAVALVDATPTTALDALSSIASGTGATYFDDPNGRIVFESYGNRGLTTFAGVWATDDTWTATSGTWGSFPVETTSTTMDTAGVMFAPQWAKNLEPLINDVTVTYGTDTSVNQSDAASIAAYGKREYRLDTQILKPHRRHH
jgi:hypothetical protein